MSSNPEAGAPARPATSGEESGLAVVVPVAGAGAVFERCAASLVAATEWRRHRLVVVLDGEQDAGVERAVGKLEAALGAALSVLASPVRQGFVASVNRALAATSGDVVLLNSDTEVTAGWLDKLAVAATRWPRVATVTPLSNNATLCSLPVAFAENLIPEGHTVESFGRLVERVSTRTYPEIPTGVGFCLLIRREAWIEVGPFDQRTFGRGYGEEVDFCLRATAKGFRHLLDDATFVYHDGQRSFGARRRHQVRAAERRVERRHPEFRAAVARFMAEDPLEPVRRPVLEALGQGVPAGPAVRRAAATTPGIVHLVHGWPRFNPAGTEGYARWLALEQARHRRVAVYARMADPQRATGQIVELLDGGARIRLVVNHFDQRNPLARNGLHDRRVQRDFGAFLDQERPSMVHVHHWSGHGLGLVAEIRRRRLPFVFQLQDWWTACARANLLDHRRRLCSGPGVAKCGHCLPLTRVTPGGLWNPLLYSLRGWLARRAVRQAAARIAGSQEIVDSLRALGVLDGLESDVLPYAVAVEPLHDRQPDARPDQGPRWRGEGPLRIGFIGSILPHKGLHVAAEALRGVAPARARLEIWGDAAADPAYTAEVRALAGDAELCFRGNFPEEEKASVLGGLDLLLVPSVGLESFGLVAREALACGTPILASRRGALANLEAEIGGEAFFPAGDAAELRRRLLAILEHPDRLEMLCRRPPVLPSPSAHAQAIEAVYARILGAAP